jgi:hypothetical protein
MSIEAMKQALEALKYSTPIPQNKWAQENAIIALRTAIEQAEKQETVAWRFTGIAGFKRFVTDAQYKAFSPEVRAWYEPFKCASYTTPPAAQQKPLTDEEYKALVDARNEAMLWAIKGRIPECGAFAGIAQNLDYLCEQLSIEAAHGIKEKNT